MNQEGTGPETTREGGLSRAARLVAELPPLLLTLWVLWQFGRTVAGRVGYPYDLEWMEGGMLLHSLRVLEGQPIYIEPSADFIPYLYPPLYSWVVAALSLLPGVELNLTLGRVVSVAGTLAACGALIAALRHERAPWGLAVGAAGLYLSTYENSGVFFDLVRTDGLLMGLSAWALVAARKGQVRRAGVLLTLAYACKHTFAIFGLPMLIWLWRSEGRAVALRFALWSVLPALAYTAAMQLSSDGNFLTWMLAVPAAHGSVMSRLFPGAQKEMFEALPYTTAAALAVGALQWRRRSSGSLYWVGVGLVALVIASVMRGHTGGFTNVLMPGHWTLALWGGLGLSGLYGRWRHPLVLGAAGALVAVQLGGAGWDRFRYLPSQADEEAGDALVEKIRGIEGEVLSPYSPWLPYMAGKRPYWHLIALWDIDYKSGPYYKASKSVDKAIAEKRWAAVLVGGDDNLGHGLKRSYKRQEKIKYKGKAFFPLSGWRRRPEYIYVPRAEGDPGPEEGAEAGAEAEEAEEAEEKPQPEPSPKLDPLGGGI